MPEKQQNAFAEWGSFMHSIFERFYKGQLDFYDICDEYENNYKNKVRLAFPYNKWTDLGKKYYEAGLEALEYFNDLPDNIEILDIECKINTMINGITFVGFADLILRKQDTNEIIIVDHKSKAKFASKSEQRKYARQLYLYAVYVKEKYGAYPSILAFNMFRVGDVVTIPFSESDLEEAKQWFSNTVSNIYMDSEFLDKIEIVYRKSEKDIEDFSKQDFFCNELCGVRAYCNRSSFAERHADDYRQKNHRKGKKKTE